MRTSEITFELLNAYVDGELGSAAAAEVARAVADDPAMAREVAALSRLRSVTAQSLEAPELRLPAPAPKTRRRVAVAASLALFIVLATAAMVATFDRSADADWIAQAWQVHRSWSLAEAAPGEPRAAILPATFVEAVPGAYVPDLTASRLSLVHTRVTSFGGQHQALLAGYRGTRGCKISLLVFPSPATFDETLNHFHDSGNEAYGWRAGQLGYVLMSDGMDAHRFRLLAASVRRTSREHLPFDVDTRIALRQSRDNSAPCTA